MDELVKLFTGGINAIIDAKNASDAEAEAAALAELDAIIAEVHPKAAALKDALAASRAAGEQAIKDKYHPKTDETTKPE